MLSRRTLGVSWLALTFAAGCGVRPRHYPLDATPDAAAARALQDLISLVTAKDFAAFGFQSFSEVQTARLDPPLNIFEIRTDRLAAYASGQPVDSLLTRSATTLYPVSVGGAVRSSVSVQQAQTGFRPSQLGEAALMQTLAANRRPGPGIEEFVVRAGGLNVTLLGRRRAGVLYLVPLFAKPDLGFPLSQELPAARVIVQMVPLATQADGRPA